MFDELVESTNKKKTHKVWSVWLSAGIQTVILGILILIPLIYTNALPKTLMSTFLVAPPPPPPPPPPPAVIKVIKVLPKLIQQGKLQAPTVIPKKIEMIHEEPQPDVGMVGGVPGGIPGGSAGGVLGGIIGGAPGLAPPKPVERIRVGGNVQAASLIRQVTPVYPPIARTAHIQGTVVLHAIIAKDGTVKELEYISGPPLLMHAAMDAVREWRYKPTLLNTQPVEVETTISVIFNIGG